MLKKYNDSILTNSDFIKCILMILVVIGHCTALWSKAGWFNQSPKEECELLSVVTTLVGVVHIYAFVIISGYIYSYLEYEKKKYSNCQEFIRKKFIRLIIPYLFVSILWAIPWQVYYFNSGIKDIFVKFFLGTSPSQLWFLLMLFEVFLIAKIFSKVIEKDIKKGVFISISLYVIGTIGLMIFPNLFQIFTSFQYFIFFYLGILLHTNYFYNIKNYTFAIVMYIILFIIYYNILLKTSLLFKILKILIKFVLNVVGGMLIILFLSKISKKIKEINIIKILTENSFIIYLFHQQLIYFIIDRTNGILHPILISTISFVFSIFISIIIGNILNHGIFKKIIGK